jgi:hypothetical protein
LLAQGDDHALRYAALELRLTLEAGVYDRLHDYRRDVPQSAYETWQPPRVLRLLLEIDPRADQPSTVRISRQPDGSGQAAAAVTFSETPVDQSTLRRNYDALGSYLHMPTIRQIERNGGSEFVKLREPCEALVEALDPMVTPAKSTFVGGRFSHSACTRCGADMRKRLPGDFSGDLTAVCLECEAPYAIEARDGQHFWTPVKYGAPCAHEGCGSKHGIFPDELKEGHRWACEGCGGENLIDLRIVAVLTDDAVGRSEPKEG